MECGGQISMMETRRNESIPAPQLFNEILLSGGGADASINRIHRAMNPAFRQCLIPPDAAGACRKRTKEERPTLLRARNVDPVILRPPPASPSLPRPPPVSSGLLRSPRASSGLLRSPRASSGLLRSVSISFGLLGVGGG